MNKKLLSLFIGVGALALASCDATHVHTFDMESFEKNETSHWHKATCNHTDLVKDLADHNYGDDNVCDDCGFTKPTPVVPHEHSFASAWSKDETNHWHAATCEHITLTSGLAAHNYGADNVCDDCGYIKPAPAHVHTYDLEHWEKTSTHHWRTSTCEHTGLASNIGEHSFNDSGECTVCGYKKEVEHYSFLLRSDYCELDNENIYEEGEEVELSLTIKDEFKASSTLPENIEVYSKGVLLTKGTDYTYEIEGETGKLSLTIKGDIVVIAFKDKNEDSFKITETQFADAMDVSDETHLQYNLTAGFYSSFSIIMHQYDVEYSPNVTYRGSYSFDASRNGGSISCDYTYIEKENEAYTEYHSDKSGVWTTRETDEGTFNGMKSLSLGWFPFISGFQLTYDRIKDNFNNATNAYEVYFTYQEYDVKFEVTFYNGKLINVSYEGIFEADRGIFGNIDVSYIEKEVSISEAAKPKKYKVINNLVVEEKTGDEQILTNFLCNQEEMINYPAGLERYDILKANYATGSTFKEMQESLYKARSSLSFNPTMNPIWISDAGTFTYDEMQNPDVITGYKEYLETEYYPGFTHDFENNIRCDDPSEAWWITVHNSTYDIQNKSFKIFVQEDYEHCFEFKI